ncbi:MAG: UPF0236 family protein, partial [Firmicutes bacterium]|nr:UPF0236 family protein [Bacillota bacterium]
MQHKAATLRLHEFVADGNSIEGLVMEAQQRFGLELLKELLEGLDEDLYKAHPPEWVCECKRERTIETMMGTLTYSRRIYRHKVTGKLFVPVDKKARFEPGQRVSEELKAMCAYLAVEMSYRAVPKVLETLRGVGVSAQEAHRCTQEVGQRRVEEVREGSRELYEKPGEERGKDSGLLVNQVDSLFARAQREKSRQIEMRLGALHSGW